MKEKEYERFSEKLYFIDNGSVIHRIFTAVLLFFSIAPPCPVRYQVARPWKWKIKNPPLCELGQEFKFQNHVLEHLEFHDLRYKLWRNLTRSLAIVAILLLLASLYFEVWETTHLIVVRFGFIILYIILIAIVSRLVSKMLARYFIDSLCVSAILYVLCDLNRSNVLLHSDLRKMLLYRIDYLAELTSGLAARYAPHSDNMLWVKSLFNKMRSDIREREKNVIAPTDKVLSDLKQDFYQMASHYISGNYGMFAQEEEHSISQVESHDNWKQTLLIGVFRFIGIIIPLALMGLYLWDKDKKFIPSSIKIESDTIALVFIAWLLFSIDSVMKLGVVAGLVEAAKSVKDLT